MTAGRLTRRIGLALAVLAGALLIYEALAIWRAYERTPAALERAAAGPLTVRDLTPERRRWLLAVEDPGFTNHKGVDFSTPGAGMTTITQSLVKRLYFDDFKPGFAKLEQSLIARLVLHPALSKDGQLTAFLNFSGFGDVEGKAVVGFEGAAQTYYGHSFRSLTDQQFLSLVAMLMAPRDLDPRRHTAANAERVRRITRLLAGECKPTGLRDVTYEACAGVARADVLNGRTRASR